MIGRARPADRSHAESRPPRHEPLSERSTSGSWPSSARIAADPPGVVGRPDAGPEREAVRDRAGHVRLGPLDRRPARPSPSASRQAMAEASVQPVPWLCRLSERAAAKLTLAPRPVRTAWSTGSPTACPPLISTHCGPSARSARGQLRRRRRLRQPGQQRGLRQIRRQHGRRRQQPGPQRRDRIRIDQRVAVLARTAPDRPRPAPGRGVGPRSGRPPDRSRRPCPACRSSPRRPRCRRPRCGTGRGPPPSGTGQTPCTPSEFWAVIAVSTLIPCTPWASIVFRSAWIPAPPPESEPATVSTRAVGSDLVIGGPGSGPSRLRRPSARRRPAPRRRPRQPRVVPTTAQPAGTCRGIGEAGRQGVVLAAGQDQLVRDRSRWRRSPPAAVRAPRKRLVPAAPSRRRPGPRDRDRRAARRRRRSARWRRPRRRWPPARTARCGTRYASTTARGDRKPAAEHQQPGRGPAEPAGRRPPPDPVRRRERSTGVATVEHAEHAHRDRDVRDGSCRRRPASPPRPAHSARSPALSPSHPAGRKIARSREADGDRNRPAAHRLDVGDVDRDRLATHLFGLGPVRRKCTFSTSTSIELSTGPVTSSTAASSPGPTSTSGRRPSETRRSRSRSSRTRRDRPRSPDRRGRSSRFMRSSSGSWADPSRGAGSVISARPARLSADPVA